MDLLKAENKELRSIIQRQENRANDCMEQLGRLVTKVKVLTAELRGTTAQLRGTTTELRGTTAQLREKNLIEPEPSAIRSPKGLPADTAKELQQFYTIDELATECINKFHEHCPAFWEDSNSFYLEPSAGEGVFLEKLPEGRRFGVDLDPKHEADPNHHPAAKEVRKMDFYHTTRELMGIDEHTPLALIGNPPFGNVAAAFFRHATEVLKADYIAWILPNSFLTRRRRDKIDPFYHLEYVMNITCCYVHKGELVNLPTMFGIWKKSIHPIVVPEIATWSPDFKIIYKRDEKRRIYKEETAGTLNEEDEGGIYFWMRRAIKHIDKKVQSPVFKKASEFIASYKGTYMRNQTPYDKLIGGWLILCPKKTYDKVTKHFSEFNWKENIGQFASGRDDKDWGLPTRINISKAHIYGAYNNDITFQPYSDEVEDPRGGIKRRQIPHDRSDLLKEHVRIVGGYTRRHHKKRTKKKKKRRKRLRSSTHIRKHRHHKRQGRNTRRR